MSSFDRKISQLDELIIPAVNDLVPIVDVSVDEFELKYIEVANLATGFIAPADAQYVTLAVHAGLINERVLTGTANQIIVTDGGAGFPVTLSTPQDIHIAATPTFGAMKLNGTLKMLEQAAADADEAGYGQVWIRTAVPNELWFTDDTGVDTQLGVGGGAPVNAEYVVLALDGVLTDERVLTGTANQVAITDGGAGGPVTLSTPQDIAAASTPTFAGLTINGNIGVTGTVDGIDIAGANSAQFVTLAVDANLPNERVLTGTANQVVVTDGGAGAAVTLSTPQDIAAASTPTFGGLTINGNITITGTIDGVDLAGIADAQYVVMAVDGDLANERVLTGTANQIIVTDGGAGLPVTLSTPQDIHTGATPTFTGLYIGGSNQELRFYEGANYVGFEAPALVADQIWVLPDEDGDASDFLQTDGGGNLTWAAMAASPWTTDANVVNLVIGTDTVTIGSAIAGGKLFIDGDADEIQLQVQAHNTQTSNLFVIEKSDGTDYSGADERGILFSHGGIDANSVYIGSDAGNTGHTNAINNIGIGTSALASLTTGDANVAIGHLAGDSINTGADNVLLGRQCGESLTGGSTNFALGSATLRACTTGSTNIAIGYSSLSATVTGGYNIAIGSDAAGQAVITGDVHNIAIGRQTLYRCTSGAYNIAIGFQAGYLLATAADTIYIGRQAGLNSTGGNNIGIGFYTSRDNGAGINNTVVGYAAGQSAAGSAYSNNTLVGYYVGNVLTTGSNNAILGYRAGGLLSTGASNIFIGANAGYRQTTLSNLLIIDNQERADVATELTNAIFYGVMAAAQANQTLRINASLFLPEKAAAVADVAAYGQLWVRNDTPNVLMFTDDAGTDFTVDVTPV